MLSKELKQLVKLSGGKVIVSDGNLKSSFVVMKLDEYLNEIESKKGTTGKQEALFEKDGEFIVYRKDGSSFDEVTVTIGKKSDDFVVIESGLEDEDVVALINPEKGTSEEVADGETTVQMPENGN